MSINYYSLIIGAIPGAIFGWFANYHISKIGEFHKACIEFRKPFVNTKIKINNMQTNNIGFDKIISIIQAGFIEQERTIELFKPYISKRKRDKLKEAYEEYKNPYNKNRDHRHINYYFEFSNSGYSKEEARQLAINNIENIINFAKFKCFWIVDIFNKYFI
jgi:hypothetical protein